MSKNVHGDPWGYKLGNCRWFLRHGSGRRRRNLPISPGYGGREPFKWPRDFDEAKALVVDEAQELAAGIGESVEVWYRGENGEEHSIGVASETGFVSYSYDPQASPKGAPDRGFIGRL